MQVDISRDLNLSKIDHRFVLLAEGKLDVELPEIVKKLVRDAKFEGRAEEVLTLLAGTPRKVTLIGLGKHEELTLRIARAGITVAGRTAKKHRDAKIALLFPYTLPDMNADETALIVADVLAQSDYKYDQFITVKKDPKKVVISATVVAPDADAKRFTPTGLPIATAVA